MAVAVSLGVFAAAGAQAAPLSVDGDLSDWGVTVADNNASVFSNIAAGIGFLQSHVEDQNDNAGDGGHVGPNQGGQNYDAEFMGAARQGNIVYLAIVSGLRPDNGFARFGPGDLRITSGTGVYGIELGGGAGGGAGGALATGDSGSTYTLNGSGFTTGHDTAAGAQTAGSIWTDVSWINDPIAPGTPTQFEIVDGISTQVGSADYVWTRNTVTNQHSIIELSFDVSTFLDSSGSGTLDIVFNPACGNDVLHLALDIPTADEVPEPAMGGLMAFGLLGLAAIRRRMKR